MNIKVVLQDIRPELQCVVNHLQAKIAYYQDVVLPIIEEEKIEVGWVSGTTKHYREWKKLKQTEFETKLLPEALLKSPAFQKKVLSYKCSAKELEPFISKDKSSSFFHRLLCMDIKAVDQKGVDKYILDKLLKEEVEYISQRYSFSTPCYYLSRGLRLLLGFESPDNFYTKESTQLMSCLGGNCTYGGDEKLKNCRYLRQSVGNPCFLRSMGMNHGLVLQLERYTKLLSLPSSTQLDISQQQLDDLYKWIQASKTDYIEDDLFVSVD